MSGLHQFVPMLHRYDAVGEHTRSLRDRLVALGVDSRIYTERIDPATASETKPYLSYIDDAEPGDILIYQFATGSAMAHWLTLRDEPLVVNYHSLTPPEYFGRWNNGIARIQTECMAQLHEIAGRVDLGIAVSAFDEGELIEAGCRATTVIPVVNVASPPIEPSVVVCAELSGRREYRRANGIDGPWWLSVGRLAPNKGHHDTIAALFIARQTTDPNAFLTIVGAPTERNYALALRNYVAVLGLDDVVEFVSGVSDDHLAAYYRTCDVLIMLSEHEGFGVPLVEAMGYELPVVAFDVGAVAEVLGDSGVVLAVKNPRRVATAIHQLLGDPVARERSITAGSQQLARLGLHDAGDRLVAAVRGVTRRIDAETPVALP